MSDKDGEKLVLTVWQHHVRLWLGWIDRGAVGTGWGEIGQMGMKWISSEDISHFKLKNNNNSKTLPQ